MKLLRSSDFEYFSNLPLSFLLGTDTSSIFQICLFHFFQERTLRVFFKFASFISFRNGHFEYFSNSPLSFLLGTDTSSIFQIRLFHIFQERTLRVFFKFASFISFRNGHFEYFSSFVTISAFTCAVKILVCHEIRTPNLRIMSPTRIQLRHRAIQKPYIYTTPVCSRS